jgi:hypothetical protein
MLYYIEVNSFLIMKTFKQFLLVTGLTIVGLLVVNAFALPLASAQTLINPTDNPVSDATGGVGNFRQLALTIVNFFLGFLGILAVLMVIYGGFLYVTSAGKQEQVDEAKKILMYAAVGIIVIFISFALVNTLLGGLGRGTDVGT